MKILKDFIKHICQFIMFLPRKMYYFQLKKRLKNNTPTIICSDCAAGVIYHNLNVKFLSPTINLYFEKKDFILFVNNLREFLNCDLEQVNDTSKNFPVGKLTYNNTTIFINFMHYVTFEEAEFKWNERKQRVDFSNLFIIQTISENLTKEDIDNFSSIKFNNKILITYENYDNIDWIVVNKVFRKKNYRPGNIFSFKSQLSVKRYIDDFDYVSFLNNRK